MSVDAYCLAVAVLHVVGWIACVNICYAAIGPDPEDELPITFLAAVISVFWFIVLPICLAIWLLCMLGKCMTYPARAYLEWRSRK